MMLFSSSSPKQTMGMLLSMARAMAVISVARRFFAIRYSELTYAKVLEDGLKATDVTAMALAMDNNMPMVCFGLEEENSIIRVVRGEKIGTTVTN